MLDDDDDDKLPADNSHNDNESKRPRLGTDVNSSATVAAAAAAAASFNSRYAHLPDWMKQTMPKPATRIRPGLTIPEYNTPASAQSANMIEQVYSIGPSNMMVTKPKKRHHPVYMKLPVDFVPTWENLVPDAPAVKPREYKSFELSLLTVSEFTITGLPVAADGPPTSTSGLRKIIKQLSKGYGMPTTFVIRSELR